MLRIPHIRKHTPQSSRQIRRGVHKRASLRQNVTHSRRPRRPIGTTFNPEQPQHTDTSQPNSRPPQPSTPKKSPRGVQRGRGFAAPLRFSFFPQKKYCAPFAKKANATQYLKKSISNLLFLYLTTRTLYIPSISLSSSNALADAALSRSIRV